MARKLVVEIIGDSKSYERALGRSSKATKAFEADVGKTTAASQALRGALSVKGGGAGFLFGSSVFVGAAAATQLISSTTAAASDLNEEITKSQQVFGRSAADIRSWSEDTATSMGISQVEALKATGTFGALFQTLAIGETQNAELSKSLVQLASDMASFNNANPEDVLLALRSGLTGEAEPLRRFGVFLSEARTQQLALAQSGKESVKQLTNQEKVLARYSIIMKDTNSAQGDFQRTSGGLANQQRILRAQTANLSATLGAVLIPALIGVVGGLNEAVGAAEGLFTALGKLADLPVIEIPVKLVRDHTQGLGVNIIKHIVLGEISPLALGILIGKEVVDGIRDGAKGAAVTEPGSGRHGAGRAEAIAAGRAAAAAPAAAAEAIRKATARANADLDQQIADSAARIKHLKELIREDPTNAKLQQRLTAEIKKQNALLEQQKSLNESNARAARDAAKAAHDASVQAAADRKQAQKDAAETRREQIKRSQFKALGLTPEGLKPTPGAGSLLKRATRLEDQIKGTPLDTRKNRSQLKTIVNFLKKNFNKAGKDVREAILSMLNDISSAFKDGAKDGAQGPLTATHGLNTRKLAEGLGLTPEQQKELRQRASKFNTAGRALGGNRTNAPGASKDPVRDRGFVLESHITVNLDGKRIANVVTRNQQKSKRRNPKQKRGPQRGD